MPRSRLPYLHILLAAAFLFKSEAELIGQTGSTVTGRLILESDSGKQRKEAGISAAVWLTPLRDSTGVPAPAADGYTLVQKNKQFIPHLLIVPVGSIVHFPNRDPLFHNVFSLFEGQRFDLGLYEAGATRDVVFTREGISYIFCNIHPEMSAVVISLATPYYSQADENGRFAIEHVPAGTYTVHFWLEGESQAVLSSLSRTMQVGHETADLGVVAAPDQRSKSPRTNEFGQPYSAADPAVY